MLNEHVARRGLMFALSSPSGAGKSTLARKLIEDDANMALSVSATTRARRGSEIDGVHFVTGCNGSGVTMMPYLGDAMGRALAGRLHPEEGAGRPQTPQLRHRPDAG